ncbi:uncharacterized protein [Antedon mediterranea]|uniref:uncharacterized protein n=1 Tax=Antedon mediterranea TaxID=105859 RepID=UPI003AF9A446
MSATRAKSKQISETTEATPMPRQLKVPATTDLRTDTSSSEIKALRKDLKEMFVDINKRIEDGISSIKSNQQVLIERITKVEETQRIMDQSLEYYTTSTTETQASVSRLNTRIDNIETELKEKNKQISNLEVNIHRMERYSRGFNLRFGGINEDENENTLDKLNKLISDKLHLKDINIENAHRTGKQTRGDQKPRQIIAKFIYRPERNEVLKKVKSLKNKDFYAMEDLTASDAKKKREYRDIMLKAYNEGRHPVFRNGSLYIDGRLYREPTK